MPRKLILSFGLISFIFVFLMGMGIWAFVSQIEESVPGTGEFIPSGKLRRVMAPVNGTVVRLLVKENQQVKAGQPLIELDPEYAEAERSGFSRQLGQLQDQVNALDAAYRGGGSRGLSPTQQAWLSATKTATESKLQSAQMQIDKSEHLYYQVQERQKKTEALLASTQALHQKYETLHQKGGLPQKDLQEYEQKLTDLKGELAALNQEAQARKLEWEQAKQQPTTILGEYNQSLLANKTQLQQSLTELDANLGKVQVTMDNQVIRAPIAGVVHTVEISGAGEYVTPTTPVISIVPLDSEMLAEVKVTNRDLSYIHLNQKALLQIDAFPYQQFGKLEGVIESISPSTLKDERGFPFYLVRIKPDRAIMEKDGKYFALRSGMTLNAQILTREKSVLSFLTEPILAHLEQAFRDPSKY